MSTRINRRQFLYRAGLTGASIALAACTSQAPARSEPAKSSNTPASSASDNNAPAKKPTLISTDLDHVVKFSYLHAMWGPTTYQKGLDYEKTLFKAGNVDINAILVPVQDLETKLPVMVAGGDAADLIWNMGPGWGPAHDWIEQGAFLPLDDLLAKYSGVRSAISEDVWNMVKSPDGKAYFIPNSLAFWVPFPLFYRADLFKELGIAEPTSIDELVAALKTIQEKKPDMVPLTTHQPFLWFFKELATCFGYQMGGWVPDPADPNQDNPAKIVPSNTTPAYKEFLGFLQMLRKENLLDPDFLVATNKNGIDKFNGGQAAVMTAHWGELRNSILQLRKIDPNADVKVMGSIQGPARKMGGITLFPYDRGFSISAKAKDRVEDIFAYLNWAFTDGYELVYHGVEGKMFTRDADGSYVDIADDTRAPGFKRENFEPFWLVPKTVDAQPQWLDMYKAFKNDGLEDKVVMMRDMFIQFAQNTMQNYNRNTYSTTNGKKGGQLYTQYLKATEEKLVIDPTTPLSLIDDAIKGWLADGGNDIIKEVNEVQKDKSNPKVTYTDTTRPLPQS